MQLFYLGAVLTRPRLADAKRQSLHDSNKRQREIPGGCPLHLSSCSQRHLCSGGQEPVHQAASLVAQGASVPRKLEVGVALETKKKKEFPALTKSREGGK